MTKKVCHARHVLSGIHPHHRHSRVNGNPGSCFIKTAQDTPQLAEGRNAQMWLDNTFERCPPACWGEFHFSFLKPLRDSVGFHYKDNIFLERLNAHVQTGDLEGNIIVAEFSGLGRYSITDHLALSAIHDLLGGELENFQENYTKAMGEVFTWQAVFKRLSMNFCYQS